VSNGELDFGPGTKKTVIPKKKLLLYETSNIVYQVYHSKDEKEK
jgi:hypothetical protein